MLSRNSSCSKKQLAEYAYDITLLTVVKTWVGNIESGVKTAVSKLSSS